LIFWNCFPRPVISNWDINSSSFYSLNSHFILLIFSFIYKYDIIFWFYLPEIFNPKRNVKDIVIYFCVINYFVILRLFYAPRKEDILSPLFPSVRTYVRTLILQQVSTRNVATVYNSDIMPKLVSTLRTNDFSVSKIYSGSMADSTGSCVLQWKWTYGRSPLESRNLKI